MLLSANILYPFSDVNNFSYANEQAWTAGDTVSVYFQLIDASRNPSLRGFQPPGLRYCPVAGATLQVQVQNLDLNKVITRFAVQNASDPSIWMLSILPTDVLSGTPDLVLTLSEPIPASSSFKVTTGRVQQAFSINPSLTGAVAIVPGVAYIGQ